MVLHVLQVATQLSHLLGLQLLLHQQCQSLLNLWKVQIGLHEGLQA